MNYKSKLFFGLSALLLFVSNAHALQPQIPTLQVCNTTKGYGKGLINIPTRSDISHSGTFTIRYEMACDPSGTPYPIGTLGFYNISMSDSMVNGHVIATTIDQVTTTGKHTPTMFVSGRCKVESLVTTPLEPTAAELNGCRYWAMIVDNNQNNTDVRTQDIVSFLVFNGFGKRIAYGTGPVVEGNVVVAPTSD